MARMLGHYRQGGCRPRIEPGPDCAGHERDTRRRKRAEQRQVRREVAAEFPESVTAHPDDPSLMYGAHAGNPSASYRFEHYDPKAGNGLRLDAGHRALV